MASVNKVTLIGNLGKDPEVRYLPSGQAIANVTLATSSRRKDKNTGEVIEDTQWHRLVFFDRLAEIAGEYLVKGSTIYVEGRLKYGQYVDKEGVTRYTTDITINEMQMLSKKESGQQSAPRQESGYQRPAPQAARQEAPRQQAAAPSRGGSSGFDDMDDDIPF